MTELPAAAPYVVVGGGVHGLSTAYHLAEELEARGRSGAEVVLLEKRHVGGGASGICGGDRPQLLPLAGAERDRAAVSGDLRARPGRLRAASGGLVAAVGEEQASELEQIAGQREQLGYESTIVTGAVDCREYLRTIFADWRAGGVTAVLHERRGGWADPNATLANLSGMARALGVRVVEGAEVQGFDLQGGLVSRIETSLGSIACDLVVVAPGPWARELWRMLELPDEIAVGDERRPMVSYYKVREGDYVLPGGERLSSRAPVLHLDLHEPLWSDRDGRQLHPGPWGIYFRPNGHGGVQGGGLPERLDSECELEPYGPSHPEHGRAGPEFDEWFTSGLAAALDRVKMLALGRLAAADILGGGAPELEPFPLGRFAAAALHPVSASPYPWT